MRWRIFGSRLLPPPRFCGTDTNWSCRSQNWSPGISSGSMPGTWRQPMRRLLDAKDLHVRESALTGESLPVDKAAGDLPAGQHGIADASNSVFLGTAVQTGNRHRSHRSHRQRHRLRRDCPTAGQAAAGDRIRPRHTPLRADDHARDHAAGALRPAGEHRPTSPAAGIVPVLGRACRRDDAGDDADDHHDHAGAGRAPDGQEEGSGQTAFGDRGLRQRGDSLQR